MDHNLSHHSLPKISFGIIVLNGEPFTKYCLRQLYPHAHEIIVVEGGSLKAREEAPQGHSVDGTLEALRDFKDNEDPENKVRIITQEGFWSEKDEQSQAYAAAASGDYLWQVDIDEFYLDSDIERIRILLAERPEICAVSFRQITFWGSPKYEVDSFHLRAENASQYHRLFRWKRYYQYVSHRPPTVVDECGVDLRRKMWLDAYATEHIGVYLYHYSLLLPQQVYNKCSYYSKSSESPSGFLPGADRWAKECYLELRHPYRVHNVFSSISWLRRSSNQHPEQARLMWEDIILGKIKAPTRDNSDVENLLSRSWYQISTVALTWWSNLWRYEPMNTMWRMMKSAQSRMVRIIGKQD